MTLSKLQIYELDGARTYDPLVNALMQMDGTELSMVQPGYFVGPLNTDMLVKAITVNEPWDLSVAGIGGYPTSYYVDDSPERFISEFHELLEADERTFAVFFTPIVKADQGPEGGWRWHKWGEYVGIGTPTTEYLWDEPKFERVYVVKIVHVRY